ncbi:MAG: hypothetical protein JWP57_4421 [Spirosoma sp.]|nr:hypothetical protein [Spirosoma sp.]
MQVSTLTQTAAQTANTKRLALELSVVRKVVATMIGAGFLLSVHDGEEITVHRSRTQRDILAALRTVDDDTLIVIGADGKRVGRVYFVYGNEPWEVVNDYSEALEPQMEVANAYADQIEAKHG